MCVCVSDELKKGRTTRSVGSVRGIDLADHLDFHRVNLDTVENISIQVSVLVKWWITVTVKQNSELKKQTSDSDHVSVDPLHRGCFVFVFCLFFVCLFFFVQTVPLMMWRIITDTIKKNK